MSVDLKKTVNEHPDAIESRRQLLSYLLDLYPKDKQEIRVLVDLLECGIPAALKGKTTIDNVTMNRLLKNALERKPDMDRDAAKNGMKKWAEAMGVTVKNIAPTSAPTPKTPGKGSNPDVGVCTEPITTPPSPVESPAPRKPEGKSKKSFIAGLFVFLFLLVALIAGWRVACSRAAENARIRIPAPSVSVSMPRTPFATPPQTLAPEEYDFASGLASLNEKDAPGDFQNTLLGANWYAQIVDFYKYQFMYKDGTLHSAYKYLLNADGTRGKELVDTFYGSSGYAYSVNTQIYDGRTRSYILTFYKPDDSDIMKLRSYCETAYDANGTNYGDFWYTPDGAVGENGYTLYEHDESGNETSRYHYRSDGVLDSYATYDNANKKAYFYDGDGYYLSMRDFSTQKKINPWWIGLFGLEL